MVDDGSGGFTERYLLGLYSGMFFEPAVRSVGPWEAATGAASSMWLMTTTTFSGLSHMIQGAISSCNLSGAIGMAETMGDAARNGVESFIGMLAMLWVGGGIILGDLLDLNLRRGLLLTNGDPSPFFTRPISAVICLVIILTIPKMRSNVC